MRKSIAESIPTDDILSKCSNNVIQNCCKFQQSANEKQKQHDSATRHDPKPNDKTLDPCTSQ